MRVFPPSDRPRRDDEFTVRGSLCVRPRFDVNQGRRNPLGLNPLWTSFFFNPFSGLFPPESVISLDRTLLRFS